MPRGTILASVTLPLLGQNTSLPSLPCRGTGGGGRVSLRVVGNVAKARNSENFLWKHWKLLVRKEGLSFAFNWCTSEKAAVSSTRIKCRFRRVCTPRKVPLKWFAGERELSCLIQLTKRYCNCESSSLGLSCPWTSKAAGRKTGQFRLIAQTVGQHRIERFSIECRK